MVVSEKQLAANRANAQKSSGPKTPAGKAVASQNAITHGLTAQSDLLPDENPEEYHQFAQALMHRLAPQNADQCVYAEAVISGLWRKHRASKLAMRLTLEHRDISPVFDQLDKLSRYETRLERLAKKAEETLRTLKRNNALARHHHDSIPPMGGTVSSRPTSATHPTGQDPQLGEVIRLLTARQDTPLKMGSFFDTVCARTLETETGGMKPHLFRWAAGREPLFSS